MQKLTNRQRQIPELKYYEELGYDEIIKLTSLKYKSVRNIVNEALKALKESMAAIVLFILTKIKSLPTQFNDTFILSIKYF